MRRSSAGDRTGVTLTADEIGRMTLSNLDAICRQLGCQPGDLLAFKADDVPGEEKLATAAS